MEVCRHKKTGKYFIYIQDSGVNEALLVTPLAEIKSLNLSQFFEVEEDDENTLLKNSLIEPAQLHRLREYQSSRSVEAVENMKYLFDKMSEYQKKDFLEWVKK